MINAVLIFNNAGQPRLTKFYSHVDISLQQRLLSEIFSLVSTRPPSACNFLPLPPLLTSTQSAFSSPTSSSLAPEPIQIIYRHYATLFFIIICDGAESELGLLDLIQVFVEALDRVFENVCELDLIFNFEVLHQVLAEVIQGGCVVETDIGRIVAAVRTQRRVAKRPEVGGGSGGSGGLGGVGGRLSGLGVLGEGGWGGR
ncbi:clathrin adaptor complex small chain-domain-containing protein [Terfezia claveryi]|nr:clathrin adaptor complex small chain-domain-containing protein [Terfezia claveryi]